MADRPIAMKIFSTVLLVALVGVLVGVLGITRMANLGDGLQQMKAQNVENMGHLATLRGGMAKMFRGMMQFSLASATPAAKVTAGNAIRAADAVVNEALADYTAAVGDSAARQAPLNQFVEGWTAYQILRNVTIFNEPVPASYTGATGNEAYAAAAANMNNGIDALQAAESSEADKAAAAGAASYRSARLVMILSLAIGLSIGLLLAFLVVRTVKRQVASVGGALNALADGDLAKPAEVQIRDEIGAMAAAVNRARMGLADTVHAIVGNSRTLDQSSQRLAGVTARIAVSAQETAAQANVAAAAADEVSSNVSNVSAGSEQMGASIREISQNANDAAQVASEAVTVVETTNETVQKLGDSSTEIGNVVKVITAIAEQTNLLALNATIEAARAGEMGKGFAVVASEVKDLAQETARATGDISNRVAAIQSDTANAVEAIAQINDIITRINDYQLTIASAVEQQTATTSEMSRSVAEAAGGVANIATNVTNVATSAQATNATLAEADATVAELSGLASELLTAVNRFRV
ncbi:methyl-accepting chemotaxis protein [Paractinoplanes brasiliensis]|uniref:methyl-accepting chemotaxis protein n=1 Tax=Paractinoplanes brasiliensis TaxID=52695 RepID=UPI001FB79C19|nr:methyl-accepting chemotaxis protein [Actinoplanes brasiliensis]